MPSAQRAQQCSTVGRANALRGQPEIRASELLNARLEPPRNVRDKLETRSPSTLITRTSRRASHAFDSTRKYYSWMRVHQQLPLLAARPGRCRPAAHAVRPQCTGVVPRQQNSAPAPQQRTPEWVDRWSENIALAGNYAPVEREVTLRGLPVEGKLPASVDGVWMRNGPNPRYEPQPGSLYHWFGERQYQRTQNRTGSLCLNGSCNSSSCANF